MKTITSAAPRGDEKNAKSGAARRIVTGIAALLVCAALGLKLPQILKTAPAPQTPPKATDTATATTGVAPVELKWRIVNSYAHDSQAFTQGLLWHGGGFYEGTGLVGKSQLRRVEFPSGKVLKKKNLPGDVFGEGLAMVGDKLVQLTWQTQRGFVYDRESFKLLEEFTYAGEGWGLTYDGKHLILSNGSSTLTYLDPQTYQPVKQLSVTVNGNALANLNELEWIDGAIWANIWKQDTIVKIDPATGQVTAYLDLTGLLPQRLRNGQEDVLNGIAYDAEKKRFFVTGKQWPRLFELKIEGGGV